MLQLPTVDAFKCVYCSTECEFQRRQEEVGVKTMVHRSIDYQDLAVYRCKSG